MTCPPPEDSVHDAAVVGGGIAGAAACRELGRAGVRTLWLVPPTADDREPFGESLAQAARPILARLGLEDVLQSSRHRSSNALFSAWGSELLLERHASLHLEGPGLVVDRRAFEGDLAAAAMCSPSVTARPTTLRAFRVEDQSWHLDLADGTSHLARIAIDATGRRAVFGRRLSPRVHHDRQMAAVAISAQRASNVEPTPATLIEAMPDGWLYAALLPDGRLSLAYFSDPDLLPAGLSSDVDTWRRLLGASVHVSRWIDDAEFDILQPPRMTSAGVAWLERCGSGSVGRGWLAVGDAAAALDPLSSHGMTTALWTGARGGRAAHAWLNGDGSAVEEYAAEVSRGVERLLAERVDVYRREARFANRPFWKRRGSLTGFDDRPRSRTA